jgi:hypothetical protein
VMVACGRNTWPALFAQHIVGESTVIDYGQ